MQNDDGTPLDLRGATAKSEIREQREQSAPLVAAFTTLIVITESAGVLQKTEVKIALTDAQTAEIQRADGYYDLLVSHANGDDIPYVVGAISFRGTVTVK